jgi:hypothetical protein
MRKDEPVLEFGRTGRLRAIFKAMMSLPPATSGLLIYAQLSNLINTMEDDFWGPDHWVPPRTFLNGKRTERIYPIYAESFHPVSRYPGTTMLLAKSELIFISRHGAFQVQTKIMDDPFGEAMNFDTRAAQILLEKADAAGHGVWHSKNMQL